MVEETTIRDRQNQEFFDRWAQKYDKFRLSPWFRYTQTLSIEQFSLTPRSRLLDVGCGTGYALYHVMSQLGAAKACGIDIAPMMIRKAHEGLPQELQTKVEFKEASAEHIPYPDHSFDHVLCTNSFHHYVNPTRALQEMRRVLVPGGELVIFESAPDLSLYMWMWDRALRIFEKGHVRYYPSTELGQIIESGGFVNAQLKVLRNEFLKDGKLFASIQIWHAQAPTTRQAGNA